MARKNTRNASGSGSIRQRPDGRWEARYTYEDELGIKKRASVYADTEKECRRKLTAILKGIDDGTYRKAQRYTVSQWLDEWINTYCKDLKPMTLEGYRSKIKTNIKPYLGTALLSSLTNLKLQKYYNQLEAGDKDHKPLSPKSIQNIHGIFHRALKQAVIAGLIPANPADNVKLPKVKKADLKPLMDDDVKRFLAAIKGNRFERLYLLALFSGMRQSEIMGLQWDDVDLDAGTITVCRQLQKLRGTGEYIFLDETKNGKRRTASIAPSIVAVLKSQRAQQAEWKLAAGSAWNNEHNLVFTDELGGHLKHNTVFYDFKAVMESLGMKSTRFHDLRHSYAVNALQAGDSIKAVQEQLGHYSTAFTMDVYAAVSDTMRKQSQDRMEAFFKSVSGQ